MKLKISKQDYSKQPVIAGVKVVEVPYFSDDGGYLLELGRWNKQVMIAFPDFNLHQMNYSEMDPGVIKAWHLHYQQDDIWFVPPSHKLLVILKDCRTRTTTKNTMMRLVLGAGKSRMVFIPRGVAHGAGNLWNKPAAILYFVNNHFTLDPKQCDEQRLPWDQFGANLWELTKG